MTNVENEAISKQKLKRFEALDQVRGLAIAFMIMAHFGPGVYDRLQITGSFRDFLEFFGRLATPAFVLIFGITLSIIYVPKALVDYKKVRRHLIKRSGLVLICSLIVSIHETIKVIVNPPSGDIAFNILAAQYNVLTFYTVAIFMTGLLIHLISKHHLRFSLIGGSVFVLFGTLLGHQILPFQGQNIAEIPRLLFVSGKYGVFVLLGCAWLMMGVGIFIRRRLEKDESFHHELFPAAIAMILIGLSDGRIVGWRTIGDLSKNYAAPPQFWYICVIGGLMILAMVFLDRYTIPVISFTLGRFGKYPLSIYVAHSFVLPSAELLRYSFPGFSKNIFNVLCILVFIGFCIHKTFMSSSGIRSNNGVQAA